jgi:HlyD family secretion protein
MWVRPALKKGKKMKKKLLTLALIVTILSFALVACANKTEATATGTTVPSTAVIAEGRLKPVEGSKLSFQASGVVDEVLVKTGDKVKSGDVLVRLANADLAAAQLLSAQQALDLLIRNEGDDRAKLWQAYLDSQKARAKAQRKWDDLDVKDIENRIEDDQHTVDDRRLELQHKQENFDKYKDLGEEDSNRKTAKDELDQAQNNLNEAISHLETTTRERDTVRAALDDALAVEAEAKHQYEISQNGPNAEKLALAKAQVAAEEGVLANYELKAPFDGVVADVSVNVGEQVGPDSVAVSVANFDAWVVETTDITELEVVKIAVGQQVNMIPDALPDVTLIGTVESISQSFKQQSGDIIYTVRIKVDKVDERMRWGMTLEVTFEPAK